MKLLYWNRSTDCCHWNGVQCDKAGHVISLDLNNESITAGSENITCLFSLQFLQSLNLANNFFNYAQLPPGFNNLTSLTYLNLSSTSFAGQVPSISQLKRLVTLDLSTLYFEGPSSLKLEMPNLKMFVQNLTELIELHLDGVNLSAQGNEWCQALSSSLLNLRVLSLSNCYLSGSIHSSLAKIQSLSVIRLNHNNLNAPVPEFLANFLNLTALNLGFCNLYGNFPASILQVPTLQTLDLSYNTLLQGTLQEFPQNGSLQTLNLSYTNFSGALPTSVGNLGMLSEIKLSNCSFSGPLPYLMANLTRLLYLDLSSNMFMGPIPSFQNGSIPSFLFALPSLQKLQLSNNHFDGLLPEFPNASLSKLDTLDLSSNNLGGAIPESLFELKRLNILSLSSNNFNGTIQLEMIYRLNNLATIDLSYNSLSIDARGTNSSFSPLSRITSLNLASCNLQSFPCLSNQSQLFHLDLSDNQIGGEIPNWIWKVGNGTLRYLNLSHNLLVGGNPDAATRGYLCGLL
ncbi:unnamed protein product [Ilex paraguariensis]|uniref:Leucine-rich repeat-containing N-terminal plant-type domain-containing protein n=1 Tax=Ilex paraguariensis TaxID=185542 RepID=A0ABC8RJX4_9AQUA